MNYFGCHNHTQYSNIGSSSLDSINKLNDLVQVAKELGLSGLAITEHDCLSGTMNLNLLQKELRQQNDEFKLAIGNEIYLIDKFPEKDTRMKYPHFILIALDRIGYQQIMALSSKAWYRSDIRFSKRRVPTEYADVEEIMKKYGQGHLVASTACIGGRLGQSILNENYEDATEFLKWCIKTFGENNFYLEMQPSKNKEQIKVNNYIIQNYGAEHCIITTDAHYGKAEDYNILEAFLRSQQENRDVKEYYEFARLMSSDEIIELMKLCNGTVEYYEQCLKNTLDIMNRVEFYDLEQKEIIPKVEMPDISLDFDLDKTFETQYPNIWKAVYNDDKQTRYCGIYCVNSLRKKERWNEKYLKQLEEEFDVFFYQTERLQSNYFSYFNGIQHFIDLAWSVECAVGPSRGSAGGCLTCYLMDVTQEDPLQYNLYFWRFVNKERVELPDIDTDFQPSRKPKFFEAIRKERGELGLMQVATFKTLTLKAAIGNAGRGYKTKEFPDGLDPDTTRYLSSLIESYRGQVATLTQSLNGDEEKGFKKNDSLIKELKSYPGLLEIIAKFEGLITNSSTHASAVILFDEEDTLLKHCSLMRAPNGDLCTCYELHNCSTAGMVKYDFLWLSTLDIQTTCFNLLKQKNKIDTNLSLRDCYKTYIDVNKIDYNDKRIWQHLYSNDVLSIFQFDAASGRKGVLTAMPKSLEEMTVLNGAIRLITPEGEEDQTQRFAKFGEDINLFEQELEEHQLSDRVKAILHEELDKTNGCCLAQETLMILVMRIANFTMKEANAIRKTLAKKKVAEIEKQKEMFLSKTKEQEPQMSDENILYLWKAYIQPQMNYSFCRAHGLAYSMVGVQCIMLGGILFPPIFWQTACLLQRSGALDDKGADYNKIAKAISLLKDRGVNVKPLNINKSMLNFELDEETNSIYYGFNGVKGIKTKCIELIMKNRPFTSIEDSIEKIKTEDGKNGIDVTSLVSLVKAGAYDELIDRTAAIETLVNLKADLKTKLNGQNLMTLYKADLIPTNTESMALSKRVFAFHQYLKKFNKDESENCIDGEYSIKNDRITDFLDEIHFTYSGDTIDKASWKSVYDIYMLEVKQYIAEHQQELLDKINQKNKTEWLEKYFPSNENFSIWEIATMGICFGTHPLENVKSVANINDLSIIPEIDKQFFSKDGHQITMYKLCMICGTVIAKDKLHHSFTLLTPNGTIDVNLRKEVFAHYDAQISRKLDNGKKEIVEKSWLNRGRMVIVHGMRQDDMFIGKKYKSSPMEHELYLITKLKTDVQPLEYQKERKKGIEEESDTTDEMSLQ